jgi:osmotically inducible protein OsmC
MTTRNASARYDGFGKTGKGHVSTDSGVLADTPYSFNTRFGDEKGTNPEELIAAAHASCFTMALSFALAGAGYTEGTLETKAAVKLEQDGAGFKVTHSDLTLTASVPGIDPEQFASLAADAEKNCPISKVLNAEITLTHTLNE